MRISPLEKTQILANPASLPLLNSNQEFSERDPMSNSPSYSSTAIPKFKSRDTACSLEHEEQPDQDCLSPVVSFFDCEGQLDHHIQIHKSDNSCSSFQAPQPEMDNLISSLPHKPLPANPHNQYYMQSQQQHPQYHPQHRRDTLPQSPAAQKESPITENSDSPELTHSYIDEASSANTPQFASNCQSKLESKASMKQSSPALTYIHQCPLRPTEPKKGLYYKNRARLHEWLRAECTKFELSRDTFANAVFLMDHYFKRSQFDSHEFLPIALCMVIIAAKMNEVKILYTVRMAQNCQIPVDKLLRLEIEVLQWFNFKINPYNFAKILTEYMKRWDQTVRSQRIQAPFLLQDTLESFLLYQELFYLCEQQLRFNKELLVSTIRTIFEVLMSTRMAPNSIRQLMETIFGQENIFARGEMGYVFQCVVEGSKEQQEYRVSLAESMKEWMQSFNAKKALLTQKYNKHRVNGMCYSNLINLQF